ncbi:ABC transporter [Babesia microti strain RI]|uniref:ABC transporter n=1 Tax=Babesia microti (strain RI) TaxID=1133968 RepID=A0A1R4AC39_BABMR|nr:ABC transporter [Babesia microti strain RI]SJK86566.1 ABC transporter [Babesia microti strain RI]|eukprot:XP_021338708.1 ABC transporter [Babesia microti strain RI]
MIMLRNVKCVKFTKIKYISSHLYNYNHLQLHSCTIGSDQCNRFSTSASQMKKILSIAWPNDRSFRYKICASMFCLAASKCSSLLVPLALASLVNKASKLNSNAQIGKALEEELSDHNNRKELISNLLVEGNFDIALCLGGYALARIFASGFGELRNSIFSSVSEGTSRHMATEAFSWIHNSNIDFIHANKTGEIATIFNRGIKAISQVLHTFVFQAIPTLLEFILVTGLLFYKVGHETALVTIFTMIGYILFTTLVTKGRIVIRKRMVSAEQSSMGLLVDSLTNAETVRVCNALPYELNNYKNCLKEYEKQAIMAQGSLSALNFGQHFIFNLGLILSMSIATLKIISGDASPGELILVNTLLFQLSIPLNMMGTTYRQIKLSMVDLKKFSDMLFSTPPLQVIKTPIIITSGNISVKNLCYKNLNNINLDIKGGSFISIVGHSGCGKTTFAKLLLGLYNPQSGNILIDGQDIHKCNIQSLRRQIGLVPQDTVLFNNTIGYNIAYGLMDIDESAIHAAADIAGIHSTIMSLPNKYDTKVGERGLMLSGGEKQRIGIARALIRAPKIIVFDEATSSLDTMTEDQILHSFRKLRNERTLIAISHRLSFSLEADAVAVIHNGTIVQYGSHKQLINSQGLYRQMWQIKH